MVESLVEDTERRTFELEADAPEFVINSAELRVIGRNVELDLLSTSGDVVARRSSRSGARTTASRVEP